MQQLVCRLIRLSEDENFEFHKWWPKVTAFVLPFKLDLFRRTISYQGQEIVVSASIGERREVKVENGHTVHYALSVWKAADEKAENAFAEAHQIPEDWPRFVHNRPIDESDLFYAADYDRNRDFHVNTWPEVKAEIAKNVDEYEVESV